MIGKLNSRVTVSNWVNAKDAGGGVTKTRTPIYSIWAKVENRTGQAVYEAGHKQAEYDYKITIRYFGTRQINTSQTVKYLDNELRVNSVQRVDEGRVSYQILKCTLYNGA